MYRVHLFTTTGLILALAGIALIPSPYPLTGTIFCLAGYFFALKEVSQYTAAFQFITVFISSLGIGFTLDQPMDHPPFLTFALILAGTGTISRMAFFRIFGYTQHVWYEPLMTVLAFMIYVLANIYHDHGWEGWIFPLPVILFQGVMAAGIMKDTKQLLNFTRSGYKISTGKVAPDFMLPDQDENLVRLSDFYEDRHLLLIFVRGDWCPGCHMMLRTYQKERKKFQEKNVLVLAIGPDPVGINKEMVMKLNLDFKVLADEGQKTAMIYGVQLSEYNHDFMEEYKEGIPLPASFLIDKKGVVQYVSRPDKVGEFLNPAKIFPIVDKLS